MRETTVGKSVHLIFVHLTSSKHHKPLSKHYFALATNPGEQFYNFTSLAAWLIVKASGKIDPPQEYDDPNATIATILDAVRQLGHSVEFAPSKLKSGCGEYCIDVLLMLAESALKLQNHQYRLPDYSEDAHDSVDVDDTEMSADGDEELSEWQDTVNGNRFTGNEFGKIFGDTESDEDDAPNLEAIKSRANPFNRGSGTGDSTHDSEDKVRIALSVVHPDSRANCDADGVLESKVDPSDWQLEVERVLPQLRVAIRSDSKDWRTHLEEMRKYKLEIDIVYEDVKSLLTRLHAELCRTLEKIHSREKYINSQVEPLLVQYKAVQDNLTEATLKYRQASGGITERSRILAELSDELDRIKNEMDERGSSMTDGSPVIRIKQAIQRLRSEMVGMDIRTGVLEHILLRAQLRLREDHRRPPFGKIDEQESSNPSFVY